MSRWRLDRSLVGHAALLLWLFALMALAWRSQPGGIHWTSPGEQRLWWAALASMSYLLACAALLWSRRPRRSIASAPSLRLVYASQTGFAEQLARDSAEALGKAGVSAQVLPLHELDADALRQAGCLLFLVSTTGEGDAPDRSFRFLQQVMADRLALPTLRYGLLALGDRSYPQFCGFGRRLDAWLQQQGAQPLFERIEVDNADPEALRCWQHQLAQLAGGDRRVEWAAPEYRRWRLVERRLLNPGSAGGPAWHLGLVPIEGAAHWQAGDIAEVLPPSRGPALRPRDYSVASLPADGRLELLVREMRSPDGQLGPGSAWLCHDAALGGEIALRLRENRSFHPPADARPLILIGNGTGLAGLRALLKARAAAGQHRNWLLFGERSAAHDGFHRQELDQWLVGGVLQRLDLAWSRDPVAPAYVQQRLREQPTRVREWLAQGAAIYVCGSAEGMAPAVDALLREQLGSGEVDVLIAQDRYRRDIY